MTSGKLAVVFLAAVYLPEKIRWLVRRAQAILFTNRVTRGQLNKRNEALQLKETRVRVFPKTEAPDFRENRGYFLPRSRHASLRAQNNNNKTPKQNKRKKQ